MTHPRELAVVADVLVEHLPDDLDVSALEISLDGDRRIVHVRTRTANRFLVDGAAVIEAVRSALAEELADPRLQLNIEELVR